MPRPKSLVLHVEIDEARRAHGCQANANHRIQKGDKRLKVRNGRTWDHYCAKCAEAMIQRDIVELKGLQGEFSSLVAGG
jgi:hypothetical protein